MSLENDKSQEPFDRIDFPWIEHDKSTPDMEKIAREGVIKLQDSCIQLDPRIAMTVMREALAQARAPLVAAVERLFALVDASYYERAKRVRDDALTDPEEK